jgi:hypothetical protein
MIVSRFPAMRHCDFNQLYAFLFICPSVRLSFHQAYVEALYRAEGGEWDFRRLKHSWWEKLILDVRGCLLL